MQISKKTLSPTKVILTIITKEEELTAIKAEVLDHFSKHHPPQIPGFRAGKAPASMLEKYLDPERLQTEFIDTAINQLYIHAIEVEKLRPIDQPSVTIKKFVPFNTLEFDCEVDVIGEIKLPDYKNIRIAKKEDKVTSKEVNEVLESLRKQSAERVDAKGAVKENDEVTIDFEGIDFKTKEPVNGADGKDYPLVIGSKSFIPGFEDNLIGLKNNDEAEFNLTFPKDYGIATLQNKKVTFKVKVKKIQELELGALDDNFAAKVSPFKNLDDLKDDIKKQLQIEKDNNILREYQNELITKIASETKLVVPEKLINGQVEKAETEEKQNLLYRGQTWEEHLKEEGLTEEQHREKNKPSAELTVKASLILSEIADKEMVTVSPEEIDLRITLLKGKYQDAQMRNELDKPENRQNIESQILTEKTFDKLVGYASKKT